MSQYYDTCVFEHAINPSSKYYQECKKITDAARVTWRVSTCPEIILAEAPIQELLEQFEAECARNGVEYERADLANARFVGKGHASLKKRLKQLGFDGQDWWHLCAALSINAIALVSDDEDFFDPSNKRNPNARKRGSAVKVVIEKDLDIKIIRPFACPAVRKGF